MPEHVTIGSEHVAIESNVVVFPVAHERLRMGYACPVCAVTEADAVHLAHHLAVTASLGRDDHLEWLGTHVPDWHERGPPELAEAITDLAPQVETPEHEHTGAAPTLEAELAAGTRLPGRGAMAGESIPDDVLREARELTAEMNRRSVASQDGSESGGGADGDTESE